MPVITWTGWLAWTNEPLRSDASVGPPTSSATSPAFSISVKVPPAAVAGMPPPAATKPVLDTLTVTVVLLVVAVIDAVGPSIAAPHPPWPVTR